MRRHRRRACDVRLRIGEQLRQLRLRSPQRRFSYQRRRPELSTLHQVVRDNLEALYATVAAGFAIAPLPDFVRRELEGFLDCGLLCSSALFFLKS